MLQKLFSSKARVEILKIFLLNPDESFYQSQLADLSEQAVMAVQREVKNLEALGLLEKKESGNRVYYKAKKSCPIFPELQSMFSKAFGE
ncbi:MAG: winged helix-turn-helix transcriptional regulator [Endomicrobiales bacterium]|nr:winged helix-turn-helix transcriptional regulator [Endomicrobiales bacterium]